MSVIGRGVVFTIGTFSNAILFLFHSRVVMEIVAIAGMFASGPATGAINLLPDVIMLAIGGLQVGLIVYFLGGLGEERTTSRRPMP